MPGFVQSDAEQVRVHPHAPALAGIEMHVARQRFRVRRRGIEGVGQDAARPVERVAVAVCAAREQDGDGARRGRASARREADAGVTRPFAEGPLDFALRRGRIQIPGERFDGVLEGHSAGRVLGPTGSHGGVVGDDSGLGERTGAARYGLACGQIGGSGKNVGHLVAGREFLQTARAPGHHEMAGEQAGILKHAEPMLKSERARPVHIHVGIEHDEVCGRRRRGQPGAQLIPRFQRTGPDRAEASQIRGWVRRNHQRRIRNVPQHAHAPARQFPANLRPGISAELQNVVRSERPFVGARRWWKRGLAAPRLEGSGSQPNGILRPGALRHQEQRQGGGSKAVHVFSGSVLALRTRWKEPFRGACATARPRPP